jgi:hypothetical protein
VCYSFFNVGAIGAANEPGIKNLNDNKRAVLTKPPHECPAHPTLRPPQPAPVLLTSPRIAQQGPSAHPAAKRGSIPRAADLREIN